MGRPRRGHRAGHGPNPPRLYAEPDWGGAALTVAVLVKVFDGVVLATDSATTVELDAGGAQVYNTANKIFHLHRRFPIAAMTWGLGNIGAASISTLAKDLRRRFMGNDLEHTDWTLGETYSVRAVADRLVEMMFDELYAPTMAGTGVSPALGFLVAGFSANDRQSEAWLVIMDDFSVRPTPVLEVGQDASGWGAYATPFPAMRLFNGFDPRIREELRPQLSPDDFAKVELALENAMGQPAYPAMPFGDAIALAKFLVEVTIGFSRYLLGPDTVGGPVDVAGISRHEGFRWISRKHYYPAELNPEDPHHVSENSIRAAEPRPSPAVPTSDPRSNGGNWQPMSDPYRQQERENSKPVTDGDQAPDHH